MRFIYQIMQICNISCYKSTNFFIFGTINQTNPWNTWISFINNNLFIKRIIWFLHFFFFLWRICNYYFALISSGKFKGEEKRIKNVTVYHITRKRRLKNITVYDIKRNKRRVRLALCRVLSFQTTKYFMDFYFYEIFNKIRFFAKYLSLYHIKNLEIFPLCY